MEKVKSFDQIEKHLKVGCRVVLKEDNEDGPYKLIIPDMYRDQYLCSEWERTLSDAMSNLAEGSICAENIDFSLSERWIADILHPPREERFKVGDEVEIVAGGRRGKIVDIAKWDSLYFVNFGCSGCGYSHYELRYPINHDEECENGNNEEEEEPKAFTKDHALQEIERLKEFIKNL